MPEEKKSKCFCPGTRFKALARSVRRRRQFSTTSFASCRRQLKIAGFSSRGPGISFEHRHRLGWCAPVFVFDILGPPGGLPAVDRGHGISDLAVIGRQIFVNRDTLDHGGRYQGNFVVGADFGLQEMEGGFPGLEDAARVVVGEIEEQEELAGQPPGLPGRDRRDASGPGAGGRRAHLSGRIQIVLFKLRQGHRPAVVGDGEIAPRQIADRMALLVGDIDLDELQGDRDLVLEGRRLFRRLLRGAAEGGRRRPEKQNEPGDHDGPNLFHDESAQRRRPRRSGDLGFIIDPEHRYANRPDILV